MEYILFSAMLLLIVFSVLGIILQIPKFIIDVQLQFYRSVRYDLAVIILFSVSTWFAVTVINNIV